MATKLRRRFRLVPGLKVEPAGWTALRPGYGIRVRVEPPLGRCSRP